MTDDTSHSDLPVWNHIPVELAIQIFRLTLPEHDSQSYYYSQYCSQYCSQYYSDLSRLCLVCKGWRDIVQSNATFWQFVTTSTPPRLLQKILECAENGGGLEVLHDGLMRKGYSDTAIACIARSSNLWTSLILLNDTFEQCRPILTNPTPILKHLYIRRIPLAAADVDLFRNAATQLESLVVLQSSFPWRSTTFATLREIKIDRPISALHFEEELIHALRSSPRLASLIIRSCSIELPPPTLIPPVHLPHLRAIDIENSPQILSALLLAIVCPPATAVAVTDTIGGLTIQHPVVSAALSYAVLDCASDPYLSIRYGRAVSVKYGNVSLTLKAGEGEFSVEEQLAFCSAFFGRFTDASTAASKVLQLEWYMGWNISSFLDIIDARFPSISRLELVCRAYSSWTANFSSFARGLTSPYSREGVTRWLLPNLETLSIRWRLSSNDWIDEVINIVRSRCGALEGTSAYDNVALGLQEPKPLRSLSLPDCTIPERSLNTLKDLLGDGADLDGVQWVIQNTEDDEECGVLSIPVP
ncbi:hypothetical protein FRC04_008458 [Tulasnella sp. 424]|nr:hypothetical protein FRC04_008458 [Tulasnella sp. 424]KAG8973940.1 hypothetical protein FRC05_007997 [Tulasnella sp. 425]